MSWAPAPQSRFHGPAHEVRYPPVGGGHVPLDMPAADAYAAGRGEDEAAACPCGRRRSPLVDVLAMAATSCLVLAGLLVLLVLFGSAPSTDLMGAAPPPPPAAAAHKPAAAAAPGVVVVDHRWAPPPGAAAPDALYTRVRLCDGAIYEDDLARRQTVRVFDLHARLHGLHMDAVVAYTCCCHHERTALVCNGMALAPFAGYELHCLLTCRPPALAPHAAGEWRLLLATGHHLNHTDTECYLRLMLDDAPRAPAGGSAPPPPPDPNYDILSRIP